IDLMERACAARNRFPPSDAPCPPYEPPTFFQPLAGAEGEDAGRPAATDAPAAAGDDRAAPSAPAPPATVAGVGGTLPATGGSAAGLLPAALAAAGLAVAALARTTAARRRA